MSARIGDRIRVTGGAWPERVGLTGLVVDGLGYPFAGKGRNEIVILIEEDPLTKPSHDPVYTCVIDYRHVEVLR